MPDTCALLSLGCDAHNIQLQEDRMTIITAFMRIVLIGAAVLSAVPINHAAAQDAPAFAAVRPEVALGGNTRIDLRLIGVVPALAPEEVVVQRLVSIWARTAWR